MITGTILSVTFFSLMLLALLKGRMEMAREFGMATLICMSMIVVVILMNESGRKMAEWILGTATIMVVLIVIARYIVDEMRNNVMRERYLR